MPALREIQQAMAAAIAQGPAHVPHALFAGDARRVRLGFAVHANTISHGRLVALEDACPETRWFLGVERFNALSRAYLDEGGGAAGALSQVAAEFPTFLHRAGEHAAAHVARFDALWLAAPSSRASAPSK